MKRSNFVRKLISGKEALELEKKVFLQIYTNCPEKWQLTDLETGDQYLGNMPIDSTKNLSWRRI
tara:strand:+ start:140 stop:331 length:192 start_codon:yes stop_codon:yes gene_type:complete